MRNNELTGLILLSFIICSCSNMSELGSITSADYNREITVPVKGSVKTKDNRYTLRFDSVVTDSRCPDGAMCVWSGVAGIKMIVSEITLTPKTLELYTLNNGNWSDSAVYKDIKIRLLLLSPYPSITEKFQYDSYRAKIVISKN
ncbi:MAG: hypothetical protein ACYC2P_09335 [Paludibacteraceae bacterium]